MGRDEGAGIFMKKYTQLILLSLIILTACGPAPAATNAPATETLPPTRHVTPLRETSTSELIIPTTLSSIVIATMQVEVAENELIAFSTEAPSGIFTISPGNGTLTQLIVGGPGYVDFGAPAWSPLGDQIAFYLDDNGKQNFFMMNSDGTKLDFAFPKKKGAARGGPEWSPDGEYILYSTTEGNYILGADGLPKEFNNIEGRGMGALTWSPDGEHIAFLSKDTYDKDTVNTGFKLFMMDKDGGNVVALTDAIVRRHQISWSPDGRKIVFSEGCGNISVVDVSSKQITQLTAPTSYADSDPAWSPDGNYIVFVRDLHNRICHFNTINNGDLFIMSADGKEIKQLTKSQEIRTPSWWPLVIMQSEWKYEVTKAGANLNVRESPSQTAVSLAKLPQGAIFTALDGLVKADGYDWWHIRTEDGAEGWMVDVPGWYMLESAP
jgi:dipeptidyl aminopeptidase/acylaminoacyl peptidase